MASRAPTLRLLIRTRTSIPCTTIRTYAANAPAADPSNPRPLYPSVQVLLHAHSLSASDIQPTGPGGRLLKGDVLAHIGSIDKKYPSELEASLNKRAHLDLSNVTPGPAAEKDAQKKADVRDAAPDADAAAAEEQDVVELSLPVDLQPALALQKRLRETLGSTVSLAELINRAVGLANVDLPYAPATQASLFAELVSSSRMSGGAAQRVSAGAFLPVINAAEYAPPAAAQKSADALFDEILGGTKRRAPVPTSPMVEQGGAVNDFSLEVEPKEEKRATVFLQRVKGFLEVEPGRLVL